MEAIRTSGNQVVCPHLDDIDPGFVKPELKLYVGVEASDGDVHGIEECESRILRARKSSDLGQREEDFVSSLAFESKEIGFATFIDRAHHARITAWQGIARAQGDQTLQPQVVGAGADKVVGPHLDDVGPAFFEVEPCLCVRIETSEISVHGAEQREPRILRARKPCGLGQREEDLVPSLTVEGEELGFTAFSDRARFQRATRKRRRNRTQRD